MFIFEVCSPGGVLIAKELKQLETNQIRYSGFDRDIVLGFHETTKLYIYYHHLVLLVLVEHRTSMKSFQALRKLSIALYLLFANKQQHSARIVCSVLNDQAFFW
jgi:hypothetical protein